jgi:hypothetical protein
MKRYEGCNGISGWFLSHLGWFIVVGVILLLILTARGNAQTLEKKDFDFTIKGTYSLYQNNEIKGGVGAKAEFTWKWLYMWGSFESANLTIGERTSIEEYRSHEPISGSVILYGIGEGVKFKIIGGLNVFGEIGYYIPTTNMGRSVNNGEFYNLNPNWGATVGLNFNQKLYKDLYVNAFGGYRYLALQEDWDKMYKGTDMCYQTEEKRNFSTVIFGIGLRYNF